MGKFIGQEIRLYLHKYSTDSSSHLANFEFDLIETLWLTGREKISVSQCVLPLLRTKFDSFYVAFDNDRKMRMEEMYISNPFDVCKTLKVLFEKHSLETGTGPILNYNEFLKTGFELLLPPNYSLSFSSNVANLLFQGKTNFKNEEDGYISQWFKISRHSEESIFYLLCDLLQNSSVDRMQLPVLNTMVLENKEGMMYSHLFWNNNDGLGEMRLRAGVQRKIKLSIVDKEGNLAWMKGGLFFVDLKICI